jgi:DNA processing protein
MNEQELLASMALTQVPYLSLATLHELYDRFGSATLILQNSNNIRDVLPDAAPRLVSALADTSAAVHRAEAEYKWAQDNGVSVIPMNSLLYPQRLAGCPDGPVVLYGKGTADLNARRVISIVGTRHCTLYGQDVIRQFMHDLHSLCPDVLVVSGLAYGVDINAHREALANGFPTVAVLAHGLDQIYPYVHHATATAMLANGGLLTEYMSQTKVMKGNFVQRNRIVAGLADATILVESAAKGGGLITLGIANDYHRDTFAFPGAVNAVYSQGCNNSIRDNQAMLVSCAEDFVKSMGWMDDSALSEAKKRGIERQIFPDLTDDERKVVDILSETNNLQINILTVKSAIPINRLTSLLFSLEMKGVIKTMAGGCYHLI